MEKDNISTDRKILTTRYINAFTNEYWNACNRNPELSRIYMKDLCQDIFDGELIHTDMYGMENIDKNRSYVFAPNHPTVLQEHKILFDNNHSLPYYIIHFDILMETLTGKKVHFVVTDPSEMIQYMPHLKDEIEQYRAIIEAMEYIMIPHGKLSAEQLESMNNQIQEYLEKGDHVSLFPEGHWYGTGNIGPIQKGLIHLMQQNPDHPVIPVRIDGFDESYKNVSFLFGKPETLDTLPKKPLDEIVQEFRDRVFVKGLGLHPVESR